MVAVTPAVPFAAACVLRAISWVAAPCCSMPAAMALEMALTSSMVLPIAPMAETTTRVVRRGDTLAGIAAEVYSDPTKWRVIADANAIENPFVLPAGSKLTLPKQ